MKRLLIALIALVATALSLGITTSAARAAPPAGTIPGIHPLVRPSGLLAATYRSRVRETQKSEEEKEEGDRAGNRRVIVTPPPPPPPAATGSTPPPEPRPVGTVRAGGNYRSIVRERASGTASSTASTAGQAVGQGVQRTLHVRRVTEETERTGRRYVVRSGSQPPPESIPEPPPPETIAQGSGSDHNASPRIAGGDRRRVPDWRDPSRWDDPEIGNVRRGGNFRADPRWYWRRGDVRYVRWSTRRTTEVPDRHDRHDGHDRHDCHCGRPVCICFVTQPRIVIVHEPPVIVREVQTEIVEREVYVYRDVPAGWSYPVAQRYEEEPFFTKGEVANEFVWRAISLSATERGRVERLIETELLGQIVTANGAEQTNTYTYEQVPSRLRVYAPMETALRVETIVRDERTFSLITEGGFSEPLVLSILSVVHPALQENDPAAARWLTRENEDAIDDLLDSLSPMRARDGKEQWLVPAVGTLVVVDTPENIGQAEALMESRPYVPRSYVRDP